MIANISLGESPTSILTVVAKGLLCAQNSVEMIQIKIRELIIFIIIIALFSSLLINCSQHSLIKALEHSIEQRDSLLNESFGGRIFCFRESQND